ncbi:Scr1 family TA system antitoxin-like transcriptional regulator [Kitasatospora sp. NPDC053057]|uniref:Scr1 family TA system antitoxin-like transcriptional regulator n=1 Tax=Kitasatospora sp. NPDC053057 TaxID=3364062 RepID=UPI0037CB24CC
MTASAARSSRGGVLRAVRTPRATVAIAKGDEDRERGADQEVGGSGSHRWAPRWAERKKRKLFRLAAGEGEGEVVAGRGVDAEVDGEPQLESRVGNGLGSEVVDGGSLGHGSHGSPRSASRRRLRRLSRVVTRVVLKRTRTRPSRAVSQRQQLVRSGKTPLRAFIHEAALRMQFGGPKVLVDQLDPLIEDAEQASISVRLIRFAVDTFPGASENLTFAEGPVPELGTVQLDVAHGGLFFDAPANLAKHRAVFARMDSMALSEDASRDLIWSVKKEVEDRYACAQVAEVEWRDKRVRRGADGGWRR